MKMTKEQCLAIIVGACHKAVPALKELSFGCEVEWDGQGREKGVFLKNTREDGVILLFNGARSAENHSKEKFEKYCKIIGHEPGLNHVLAAMQSLDSNNDNRHWVVNRLGDFLNNNLSPLPKSHSLVGPTWNLSHGLYQQDLPVLTFLAELLEENK